MLQYGSSGDLDGCAVGNIANVDDLYGVHSSRLILICALVESTRPQNAVHTKIEGPALSRKKEQFYCARIQQIKLTRQFRESKTHILILSAIFRSHLHHDCCVCSSF